MSSSSDTDDYDGAPDRPARRPPREAPRTPPSADGLGEGVSIAARARATVDMDSDSDSSDGQPPSYDSPVAAVVYGSSGHSGVAPAPVPASASAPEEAEPEPAPEEPEEPEPEAEPAPEPEPAPAPPQDQDQPQDQPRPNFPVPPIPPSPGGPGGPGGASPAALPPPPDDSESASLLWVSDRPPESELPLATRLHDSLRRREEKQGKAMGKGKGKGKGKKSPRPRPRPRTPKRTPPPPKTSAAEEPDDGERPPWNSSTAVIAERKSTPRRRQPQQRPSPRRHPDAFPGPPEHPAVKRQTVAFSDWRSLAQSPPTQPPPAAQDRRDNVLARALEDSRRENEALRQQLDAAMTAQRGLAAVADRARGHSSEELEAVQQQLARERQEWAAQLAAARGEVAAARDAERDRARGAEAELRAALEQAAADNNALHALLRQARAEDASAVTAVIEERQQLFQRSVQLESTLSLEQQRRAETGERVGEQAVLLRRLEGDLERSREETARALEAQRELHGQVRAVKADLVAAEERLEEERRSGEAAQLRQLRAERAELSDRLQLAMDEVNAHKGEVASLRARNAELEAALQELPMLQQTAEMLTAELREQRAGQQGEAAAAVKRELELKAERDAARREQHALAMEHAKLEQAARDSAATLAALQRDVQGRVRASAEQALRCQLENQELSRELAAARAQASSEDLRQAQLVETLRAAKRDADSERDAMAGVVRQLRRQVTEERGNAAAAKERASAATARHHERMQELEVQLRRMQVALSDQQSKNVGLQQQNLQLHRELGSRAGAS